MLNFTSEPIHSYADDSTLCTSFRFRKYPSVQQIVDSRNYTRTILEEDIYTLSSAGVSKTRLDLTQKSHNWSFFIIVITLILIQFSKTQLFLLHHYFPSWVLILIAGCSGQIMPRLYVTGLQKRWVCFTKPDIISIVINIQQYTRVTLGLRCSSVRRCGMQNRAIRLLNDRRVTDDIPSLQIRKMLLI